MVDSFAFSIIIPHRNIPHLLQRCLNSIPEREDVQIIVVDDNSDANLVDFETFPGVNRNNVELIFSKETKGAGNARNVGLSKAKGKWVLFIDADDYFNYCFNDILDEYKCLNYDLMFFSANSVNSETYENASRAKHLRNYIRMYFNGETEKALTLLRYKFGEPWSKIIKRSLIESNKILFDETLIHNDTTFSYLVGHYSSSISVDKRCLCCNTERNSSVSVLIDDKRELTRIYVFARASLFYKKNLIKINESWHYYQLAIRFIRGGKGYQAGYDILKKLGYKRNEIILGVLPQIFKVYAKKILRIKL